MKRILVIGATSKIAQQFIRSCPASYEVYSTSKNNLLATERQYTVDLTEPQQISVLLEKISGIRFDAILFFAATYRRDPESRDDYFAAYQKDLQLNAASIVAIARGVTLADNSKLFMFGDAGLAHPKKGFTSYSMSKLAVADIARMLAVELAPRTSTFCLRLGPTLKKDVSSDDIYYRKGLLKISKPVDGLINLLKFLIAEPNFNATGCIIDYDGGAYIKRSG